MHILGEKTEMKAVLFDKDGTLIDLTSIWIPWIHDIHRYLNQQRLCNLSLMELRNTFGVGENDKDVDPKGPLAISSLQESETIISFILYKHGMPWDLAVTHSKESIRYANNRQNDSPSLIPVCGVKKFLEKLKERNIVLGVMTADDTERAWKHLRKVELESYFDFVIGGDQVKNGKPYPEMAFLARDRHGVNLSETIMIRDTNADMQLGKRAGVKATVGIVTYAKNKTDHLIDADFIIHSYDDLLV